MYVIPALQFPEFGKPCVHDLLAAFVKLHCDFVVPGGFLKGLDGAIAVSHVAHAVAAVVIGLGRSRHPFLQAAQRFGFSCRCLRNIGLFGVISMGLDIDGLQAFMSQGVRSGCSPGYTCGGTCRSSWRAACRAAFCSTCRAACCCTSPVQKF